MKPWDLALFAACVANWGTTWIAIKFQLGEVAPITSVAVRFFCAALLAAFVARLRGQVSKFSGRLHLLLLGMGLSMFTVGYACVYLAETYVISALVALGYSVSPLANQLGERIAFSRPLDPRLTWAGATGVVGVLLIYFPEVRQETWSKETLAGLAFTAIAVISSAVGALFAQRLGQLGVSVWTKMAWSMAYGALGAFLVALCVGETMRLPTRWSYYSSLSYLVLLGSVAAFACYLTLLDRIGSVRTGYIGVVVPVLALIVSVLFEGYQMTTIAYLGIALVVSGSVAMNRIRAT